MVGDLRCVRGVHSECHNVGSQVEIGHVERCKSSVQVVKRQHVEEDGGDHANKRTEYHPCTTKMLVGEVLCAQENAAIAHVTCDCLYDTGWHCEEGRPLGSISETIDNQGCELKRLAMPLSL